jgi:transposase, IS5 family
MTRDTLSCSAVSELASLLDSPQIKVFIADLDETRWTGRPGYPIRSMIGIALAKSLYSISTWTKMIALIKEHESLAKVIAPDGDIPSVFACYRFAKKLMEYEDLLEKCLDKTITSFRKKNPEFGKNIAIDASDMPAYARGMKADTERSSDPDASWGYRSAVSTRASGLFFGHKLHLAVCSKTDLPLAWRVETGKANESMMVAPLLDKLHTLGIDPETCAMDKGYDHRRVYGECDERDVLPVIPLRNSRDVKIGGNLPPYCKHGNWCFAGADHKRGATKWRCPTGECKPASVWVKATRLKPLIPRSTPRWKTLYCGRGSVERAFGRLKHTWAMLPLRIRGLKKVKLHVDLTILTKLSCALIRRTAKDLIRKEKVAS